MITIMNIATTIVITTFFNFFFLFHLRHPDPRQTNCQNQRGGAVITTLINTSPMDEGIETTDWVGITPSRKIVQTPESLLMHRTMLLGVKLEGQVIP
jgi:hypothetical protein